MIFHRRGWIYVKVATSSTVHRSVVRCAAVGWKQKQNLQINTARSVNGDTMSDRTHTFMFGIEIVLMLLMMYFIMHNDTARNAAQSSITRTERVDTVFRTIPAPPPDTITRTQVLTRVEYKRDTQTVQRLLTQYDSLRGLLNNSDARSVLTAQAVNKRNDTVQVDCDEITRSIRFQFAYAAQQEREIQRTITERETLTETKYKRFGVGVSAGYGYTMSTLFSAGGFTRGEPYVGISLSYIIIGL